MDVSNPNEVSFECIYGEKTDERIEEIISLWDELGIKTGKDDPKERAKQGLFVARNSNKKIIGITTAYPSFVKHLKNNMFIFRILIHNQFRIPGLMHELISHSLNYLEAEHGQEKSNCLGILTIVENERMKKIRDVYTHSNLNFIGFAPNGHPIRAYFFKGAKF